MGGGALPMSNNVLSIFLTAIILVFVVVVIFLGSILF